MHLRTNELALLTPGAVDEQQQVPRSSRLGALFLSAAILATAILAVMYKVSDSPLLKNFSGSIELQWSNPGTCRVLTNDSAGFPNLHRVASWFDNRPAAVASCVSDWVVPTGNYLELEYAGFRAPGSSYELFFGIERSLSKDIVKLYPRTGEKLGAWHIVGHLLPNLAVGEKIRVHLIDNDPEVGWLSLRRRANFYTAAEWGVLLRDWGAQSRTILRLVLAAAIVGVLWLAAPVATSFWRVFALALVLSVFVHFRPDVFFHNDDFAFFARFNEFGWRSIFQNHFDHFMPVFVSLLFFEYSIFKSEFLFYQSLTFFLHAANAGLLWVVLRRLNCNQRAAIYLACGLFACSWLQLAALQWLTCQSIVLSMSARLLAYVLALNVLERGGRLRSFGLFLVMISAPLCFAGGITIAAEVFALALLFGAAASSSRRSVIDASFVAAFTSIVLYFFSMFGAELVHRRVSLSNILELHDLFWFTVLGSQFGTLVRGLVPYDLSGLMHPFLGLPSYAVPVLFGLAVAGFFLALSLRRKNGSLKYWLFAQLLLVTPIFLAGIGRLHWGGVEYSLTVRYHAISLIGVCLMLVPIVRIRAAHSLIVGALFFVWFNFQFTSIGSEQEYSYRGRQDKNYAMQLDEWVGRIHDRSIKRFDASGTNLEGLYPLPYGGLWFDPHGYRPVDEPYAFFYLLVFGEARRDTAQRVLATYTLPVK